MRKVLALDNANQIRVSGPAALADTLREQIGVDAEKLTVEKTEGFDIEVEIDRTLFASRLADWSKALSEVL